MMNNISTDKSESRILVQGIFRVALSSFLGQQDIHVTLLDRAEEGDFEQIIGSVISRSGSRHILIAGVMASAVYSNEQSNSVSLLNGEIYIFSRMDLPMSLQSKALNEFADIRKIIPKSNLIAICPTSPELASESGLFDKLPGAEDNAAVFVVGYGKEYSNFLARFFTCVNSSGKARGFVHSIVSLYDSTRIVNQDLEKLRSIEKPIEKLKYFWDMESLRWGATQMPNLLEIIED